MSSVVVVLLGYNQPERRGYLPNSQEIRVYTTQEPLISKLARANPSSTLQSALHLTGTVFASDDLRSGSLESISSADILWEIPKMLKIEFLLNSTGDPDHKWCCVPSKRLKRLHSVLLQEVWDQ